VSAFEQTKNGPFGEPRHNKPKDRDRTVLKGRAVSGAPAAIAVNGENLSRTGQHRSVSGHGFSSAARTPGIAVLYMLRKNSTRREAGVSTPT